jgi:heme-degrading monooxygenase HmoA
VRGDDDEVRSDACCADPEVTSRPRRRTEATVAADAEADGSSIASTPEPPYVAVIFTSLRHPEDDGYADTAAAMFELARRQDGYLGVESARAGLGITVSYWRDEDAARAWKRVAEHLAAQRMGRDRWYADYKVRVASVVRDYGPATSQLG